MFDEIYKSSTLHGLAELERELGRLTMAREDERSNALHRAAYALAQLVARGELSGKQAAKGLSRVAILIGLDVENARDAIVFGWKAGEQDILFADRETDFLSRRESDEASQRVLLEDLVAEHRGGGA